MPVDPRRHGEPLQDGDASADAVLDRLAAEAEPCVDGAGDERLAAERRRAAALAEALGPRPSLAYLRYVAELAVAISSGDGSADDVLRVVDRCAANLGEDERVARAAVVAFAAHTSGAAELSPRRAAETVLRLVVALGPFAAASLWLDRGGGAEAVASTDEQSVTRRAREVAASALAGGDGAAPGSRARLTAFPIFRWDRPAGAVVVRSGRGTDSNALALGREAAASLAATVAAIDRGKQDVTRERSLVEATERRLVRLGLDLHDGPLQGLAALIAEVRLLREQLRGAGVEDANRELVVGRLNDFEARTLAVESEIRELVSSFELGAVANVPLPQLVERELAKFGRSRTKATLTVRGNPEPMTRSQRTALLRVVQEALSNVRDHSRAAHVRVTLSLGASHLRAEISDDGRGFDVQRTFADAPRTGRLGLVGIAERIRLLGGRLDVTSGEGGPTTIGVSIPRWQPD